MAVTKDAIIQRTKLALIFMLLRFKLIRFMLNVLLLHCKINQILHHLKKRIMSGKWFELWQIGWISGIEYFKISLVIW